MPSSLHKRILIFLGLAIIFLAVGLKPEEGRVVTTKDKLSTIQESQTPSSVQGEAAATPRPDISNDKLTTGQTGGDTPQKTDALWPGAFTPSANLLNSPFVQKADIYEPEISAGVVLVADLESGISYLEKAATRHWPIASITKLMTAVVASQVFSSETIITLASENFATGEASSTPTLAPGEEYRIADLTQIMLIASDNAAAEALAQSYGRDAFLKKMNEQAHLWGMTRTYFDDPSGLSPVNQSSAEDLEKLAFQLTNRYGDVLKTSRQPGARVMEQSSKKQRSVKPINLFAGRSDFLGGKTGFIDEAGGNLLSIFKVKQRPILIVVLNSAGRFEDTEKLLYWFKENYE